MRDYRKWKTSTPSVSSLQLDALNPRIPRGRGITEQRDLIAELVEHDNVYALAKDIVADGYYPLEYLIVVEEGDKTVVVEGNRRLAALKLLINPALAATDSDVTKFKRLSSGISLDLIAKVPVIYAPSREDAAPLIMQKHTRRQIEGWSTLMQASFFKALAESGVNLADLAKQYNRTPSEIAGFLRLDTMYAIACSLDYSDEIAKTVRDPRQFNAAVLDRVLGVPESRKFLGIEFKDQVKLQGNVATRDFKKAYGKIISDIATAEIDTRKLNKAADVEQYLSDLSAYKPKKDSKGSFSADDFKIDVPDIAKGTAGSGKDKRAPKKKKSVTMIPAGMRCDLENERISDIFLELRRLNTEQFPNACMVMFRILLELCLGEYLEDTRQIAPLLAKAKKDGKPAGWFPALRALLRLAVQDPAIKGSLKTLALKRIIRITDDKESPLSLDDLDGFVHSPYTHPTGREMRGHWQAFEGMFDVILKPPPATKPKK